MSEIEEAAVSGASDEPIARGGCLCGRVRWRVAGKMEPIVACHCSQCRRQSSHFMAFTATTRDALTVEGAEGLTWYRASPGARRGFCSTCGSHLFWQADGKERISITAGSFDGATGLTMAQHIFCADKGDYYEITDGIEQLAAW